jgi:Holliday junction resolvase RusA-like endonuclease
MLDIFLEITPTAKERPRLGKHGNVYTPPKTKSAEEEISYLLKVALLRTGNKITNKPVFVKLIFQYPYPRGKTQKDKLYKTTRPDLDNLIKLVMDSMNELIFYDDNQVVRLESEKIYSDKQGIDIKVREL